MSPSAANHSQFWIYWQVLQWNLLRFQWKMVQNQWKDHSYDHGDTGNDSYFQLGAGACNELGSHGLRSEYIKTSTVS